MSDPCDGCSAAGDGCDKSSCQGENGGAEPTGRAAFLEKPHELTNVKKIIGVVSGKGGVGKSLVASLLAVLLRRRGAAVALLDADITGPSIPKAFGITAKAESDGTAAYPVTTRSGIRLMSFNLLLEDQATPVIWRGPVIAGTVKQFWSSVVWGDVDYMVVDMPPGTGDVPLTVFQSIPVNGVVVVATPQEAVSLIVKKAMNMARMMDVPMLGLVENMSYAVCPDCGRKISVFGESSLDKLAGEFAIPATARIPLEPGLSALCDQGKIEDFQGGWLDDMVERFVSGACHGKAEQ